VNVQPPVPKNPRNPLADFYSPYFGPVTLVVAAIVLIGSIQLGRYLGGQGLVNQSYASPTPAPVARKVAPAHPHPARVKVSQKKHS